MRQYRGKRVDNGKWAKGYYVVEGCKKPKPHFIVTDGGAWHEVIPSTVGQSTGAKDGNKTKIYDGDILDPHPDPTKNAYQKYLRTVEWNDYLMQWQAKFKDGSGEFLTTGMCEKCEIVGTIHDKEAK